MKFGKLDDSVFLYCVCVWRSPFGISLEVIDSKPSALARTRAGHLGE